MSAGLARPRQTAARKAAGSAGHAPVRAGSQRRASQAAAERGKRSGTPPVARRRSVPLSARRAPQRALRKAHTVLPMRLTALRSDAASSAREVCATRKNRRAIIKGLQCAERSATARTPAAGLARRPASLGRGRPLRGKQPAGEAAGHARLVRAGRRAHRKLRPSECTRRRPRAEPAQLPRRCPSDTGGNSTTSSARISTPLPLVSVKAASGRCGYQRRHGSLRALEEDERGRRPCTALMRLEGPPPVAQNSARVMNIIGAPVGCSLQGGLGLGTGRREQSTIRPCISRLPRYPKVQRNFAHVVTLVAAYGVGDSATSLP